MVSMVVVFPDFLLPTTAIIGMVGVLPLCVPKAILEFKSRG
jgi:hypothetical protein